MNNKEEKITISVNEEILYNRLYERTREFGRNQFVREITRLEIENKQLKEDFQALRVTNISLNDLVNSCQKEIRNLQQERDKYKSIVDGINKFTKERINFLEEEKKEFEQDLYNDFEVNRDEIRIRECNITQLEDVLDKIKELEEGNINE